jgi:hypothetical protein
MWSSLIIGYSSIFSARIEALFTGRELIVWPKLVSLWRRLMPSGTREQGNSRHSSFEAFFLGPMKFDTIH